MAFSPTVPALSHKGNNRVIDMHVGDMYGGTDYAKVGLTSAAIATSFGKIISDKKELTDYNSEDLARSLLRMILITLDRSKGEAKAMFLKHDGFLGVLGAFMSYENHASNDLNDHESFECSVYRYMKLNYISQVQSCKIPNFGECMPESHHSGHGVIP